MKRILITGFDPFGGEKINPAWEAVQRLPGRIGAAELTVMQVPTVFAEAAQAVLAHAEMQPPDAIVCVGQAGGRAAVTPEISTKPNAFPILSSSGSAGHYPGSPGRGNSD